MMRVPAAAEMICRVHCHMQYVGSCGQTAGLLAVQAAATDRQYDSDCDLCFLFPMASRS